MIGIYKITNKLNGKSYIGQSIHCDKRIEEHCRGKKQFIDETIQLEGKENFTFELLEECDKNQLSEREDYYIAKYNTMFPNGYNKRWNTSFKNRLNIKEMSYPISKDSDIIDEEFYIKSYVAKETELFRECFLYDIGKSSKIQTEYLKECGRSKTHEEYEQIHYKYIKIFTQLLKDLNS